jgi:hypothetical protein
MTEQEPFDSLRAATDRATTAPLGPSSARSSPRFGRWIGHTVHAEYDLTVSPVLSLVATHAIAHHAEQHLLERAGRLTGATSPAGAHVEAATMWNHASELAAV